MDAKGGILSRRGFRVIALVLTIAVGLASRKIQSPLPWAVQKELGDVLWAMAAYWLIAVLRPGWAMSRVAILAAVLAMASECSQLSHAAWLESLRHYRLGHLLLGSGFSWLDMAMYPLGAAIAWAIDRMSRPTHGSEGARLKN